MWEGESTHCPSQRCYSGGGGSDGGGSGTWRWRSDSDRTEMCGGGGGREEVWGAETERALYSAAGGLGIRIGGIPKTTARVGQRPGEPTTTSPRGHRTAGWGRRVAGCWVEGWVVSRRLVSIEEDARDSCKSQMDPVAGGEPSRDPPERTLATYGNWLGPH